MKGMKLFVKILLILLVLTVPAIAIYYAVTGKKVKTDGWCLPFVTPCDGDTSSCNWRKFKCKVADEPKPSTNA